MEGKRTKIPKITPMTLYKIIDLIIRLLNLSKIKNVYAILDIVTNQIQNRFLG